jgi:hypothetical protein
MNFTELIGTVGMSGACMVVLALWVNKQVENNREDTQRTIDILREDAKEDKERLLEEIAYNREVVAKIVATNEILSKDLTVKVDKIMEKMNV